MEVINLEELLYRLQFLHSIKLVISSMYSEVNESTEYHDCVELLLDYETTILKKMEEI